MSTEIPFSYYYTTNGFANLLDVDFSDWLISCSDICAPSTDLHEYSEYKHLVKSVDLYGRDIPANENSGFVIQMFSDQTVSKTYRF